MTELPLARKHHRHPMLVRRRNHLGVPDRATRLDNRLHTRLDRLVDAVTEREVGVGAENGPGRLMTGRPGLVHRHEGRVYPRHLAGPYADRRAVAYEHDRVRFDGPYRPPGEQHVPALLGRRLAPRRDLP